MSESVVFDVFVSDPAQLSIDLGLYRQWLQGISASEVFAHQKQQVFAEYDVKTATSQLQLHRLAQCIERDVEDQYRVFSMLKHCLHDPKLLGQHSPVPLSLDMRDEFVRGYYDFDGELVRELLGKKLSSKLKKYLDDISDKSKIRLHSCQRQLDNLRSIYRVCVGDEENVTHQKALRTVIEEEFLLPTELASKYARIVFLSRYRFDTTGKKHLFSCKYEDFDFFALVLMDEWSAPLSHHDELDTAFIDELKVLKVSMLADRRGLDDYANAVVTSFTRVPSMSHLPPLPGDRPAVGATPRSDAKMEPSLGGGLGATVSVRTAGPAGSSGGGQVMTVSLTKFLDPVATSAGADTAAFEIRPGKLAKKLSSGKVNSIVKSLVNIAAGLAKENNMRGLFIDLMEEVVRPISKLGLTVHEVTVVFVRMHECFSQVSFRSQELISAVWLRYLSAAAKICVVMFKREIDPSSRDSFVWHMPAFFRSLKRDMAGAAAAARSPRPAGRLSGSAHSTSHNNQSHHSHGAPLHALSYSHAHTLTPSQQQQQRARDDDGFGVFLSRSEEALRK